MTAICAGHYHNPLNDHYRVGRKHYHQNRFRPRQSTRSAFYKPGFTATTTNKNTTTTNNNNNNNANDPPVCVWAQQPRERSATSFVFRPGQRGAIEGYNTERALLLPLVENVKNEQEQQQQHRAQEGVVCTGEPSIDPSRAAQAGGIGDSEWWE
mmetsp:Transcript_25253/g.53189  ORF Transcript_25253/g.53189 Transcript_25253/m.53189 type:complete len:154 (-) Transcript_25253:1433-1894(-)